MFKFISMRVPETHATYEIPVNAILARRHREIAEEQGILGLPIDEQIRLVAPTIRAELASPEKFIDYVRSLPWEALADAARIVQWDGPQPNPATAQWSGPYDEPIPVTIPGAIQQPAAPLDLYMSGLRQQQSPMCLNVLAGEDGNATGALILYRGDEDAVQAVIGLLSQLTKQMAENPDGRPVRPAYPH